MRYRSLITALAIPALLLLGGGVASASTTGGGPVNTPGLSLSTPGGPLAPHAAQAGIVPEFPAVPPPGPSCQTGNEYYKNGQPYVDHWYMSGNVFTAPTNGPQLFCLVDIHDNGTIFEMEAVGGTGAGNCITARTADDYMILSGCANGQADESFYVQRVGMLGDIIANSAWGTSYCLASGEAAGSDWYMQKNDSQGLICGPNGWEAVTGITFVSS